MMVKCGQCINRFISSRNCICKGPVVTKAKEFVREASSEQSPEDLGFGDTLTMRDFKGSI